ncbi:signal peptidase 21 kDa subunit [Gregarina niphandrodes]|uniref:Signal peptidase complex catalytic subunit SEC11 n=1 Tax=Gregarina niphandrodes TaxID=110365 RepID=A0A023AYV8_GRENI|nr:signal peptidase 21 kDa subunit [Gregarina niphandrodes]EZG43846.1 signal peptidase 21 kDa subunit [Gregarina niphandrodes]|eukprot:XP_011132967.1 signal peptidase 21 kDa subunit [Gregarina niphandrodes]
MIEILDDVWRAIKRLIVQPRKCLHTGANGGVMILTAFVAWKCLMLLTNCASPVVVVLSGSMEPGMYRGDILFLRNPGTYHTGDVVVYNLKGRDIPIVHRVLSVHQRDDGNQMLLTKGDNNNVDDRGLYNRGQMWLTEDDIYGTAYAYAPSLGMATIWINEWQGAKQLLILAMVIAAMMGKEI